MINLDEELSRSLERRADNVTVRDDLDDILARTNVVRFSDTNPKPKRRSQLLLVAAASALVAGTAGLAWVQNSRSEPGSTAQQPAIPTADESLPAVSPLDLSLSGVGAIAADEWLWPTVLPDGFEYQYANRNNDPSGDSKSVWFGTAGSLTGQLGIWVSTEVSSSERGEANEVAGRNWTITSSAGQARGTTAIGDRYIDISGPVTETDLVAIIDGLARVSEAQLPSAPLTYSDAMTDVGQFDVNGKQVIMSADESNDWFCTGTRTSSEGGGGCVTYFDPSQTISRYHGTSYGLIESTSELQLSTQGMASTDVARIEVEFVNGATASVAPQNTSDEFPDVLFWAVGAVVELEPGQDPDALNHVFVEIRAFDGDGALLDTRTIGDDTVGQ